jgi:type VI secretion system protein VasI
VAGLLSLIWLGGSLASIFFIFRPNPAFPPYASRKRATGMLVAFFLGIPIFGGLTGLLNDKPNSTAASSGIATSQTAATPAAADAKVEPPSAWSVSEETSPLDDSRNVYATVSADDKIKGWLTSERPTLSVRCKEGKLDVYLDTKSQITSDLDFDSGQSLAPIKYRVGSGAHVSARDPLSSDGKAIFFRHPEGLVGSLRTADRFVVEYTPFQSGLGVATFNITGSAEALSKVLAACHRS